MAKWFAFILFLLNEQKDAAASAWITSKICSPLPAVKITQIKEFTPTAWVRATPGDKIWQRETS
jgi:hypothetical protein